MFPLPNGAHLHLLINHFPIMGIIFGLGLLIYGAYYKNESIINASYVFFILAALTGFMSLFTGGLAANIIVDLPGISRLALRTHRDMAQIATFGTSILGAMSLIALILKSKNKKDFLMIYILIVAIIMTVAISYVGYTGGLIRHSEINIPTSNIN